MKVSKIQPRSETGVTPFCSPDSSDISLGKEFLLCQNSHISFTLWVCRQDGTLTSANTVWSPHDLSRFHKMTALSQLRRLVAGLSPRIPWIDPRPVYLVLMLDKVAIKHVFLKLNNCPTRCDLFSLLHICRQLYMFRVLTPIIRSSYNCNYSFWHWSTGSITIRSCC